MCSRQHLHPIPFRAQTSRYQHLFAGLFGRNRPRSLLIICCLLIYIHSCLFVSVSIRVFCVEGSCPCVSLLIRNRFSHFLSSTSSPALRFKTPVVLPRFSTHARSNATTCEPNSFQSITPMVLPHALHIVMDLLDNIIRQKSLPFC